VVSLRYANGSPLSAARYDDVLTAESAGSVEQMQKVLDALDMSQNLGKVDGVARMIGTRYALGDPYEVYSRRGQFKARVKPATDNGRVDGKPVYFSQEVWESKSMHVGGHSGFADVAKSDGVR